LCDFNKHSNVTNLSKILNINISVFWGITPYGSRKVNEISKEHVAFIFRIEEETTKEAKVKEVASRAYYSNLKMEGHAPLERRLIFNGLHAIIAQKREPFITIAVRASNPASQ
jgi:hypothetical protein